MFSLRLFNARCGQGVLISKLLFYASVIPDLITEPRNWDLGHFAADLVICLILVKMALSSAREPIFPPGTVQASTQLRAGSDYRTACVGDESVVPGGDVT